MSIASDDDADAITDINITPLVDIILVLLIIFMMTAGYIINPSIKVNLPKASTAETTLYSPLSVVVEADGATYLNGSRVTDAELKVFVQSERQKNPDIEAVLSGDARVPHGRIVALVDLMKREGVLKFALSTDVAPKTDGAP